MMVLVSMKIVIEGIFLFITCYRFVSILSAEWDEFFSYASVCEREVIGVGDDMAWMISEFASVGNVTVRTLRYYDKINLLKPSDYTEGGIGYIRKMICMCCSKFNHLSISIFHLEKFKILYCSVI